MLQRRNSLRLLFVASVFCSLGFVSSCVRLKQVEPPGPRKATLIVTRSADKAHLSWESKIGATYSVLYARGWDADANWKVLPGAERVLGTGAQISLTDKIPAGAQRLYRLRVLSYAR